MATRINITKTPLVDLLTVAAIAVAALLIIAPASVIGSADVASNAVALDTTAAACEPAVVPLTAGQTNVVGTLTIWNDSQNLYVRYDLTTGCTFGSLHLWAGNDLSKVPSTKPPNSNPIPGKFPYKFDASGQTSHTFSIPLVNILPDQTEFCDAQVYILAHAEVICGGNKETAFGGNYGVRINEPGRWYYYESYTICCDEPIEPPTETCETAFAKGGYILGANDNPENLPSLDLQGNRWGWVINILNADSETTYNLWAGAGKNDISKGTLVGTVTVKKHLDEVTVTYTVTTGAIQELHIYVGDAKPTTSAPGQYGYTVSFNPKVTTHTATFRDINDLDGDGIWIIAHAVVCTAASE